METDTGTNAGETTQVSEDDGFIAVQTQRYMYNVEKCKEMPLVGWLLSLVEMPPIDGRVWHAFVIRTTKPTLGIDRDDNVTPVAEGSDVLIPATHELGQYLMKPAFNPRVVFKVKIQADKKISVGKSRNMWTFKISAHPTPMLRSGFGIIALLGDKPKPTMTLLTTGETVAGGPGGGDDEIPF
jgi:hypothetical protein